MDPMQARLRERQSLRAAMSLRSFHAMERLFMCPLIQLGDPTMVCPHCQLGSDKIRMADAMVRACEPPGSILHRCQLGGARIPKCATLLDRPAHTAPCESPECWPLPQGNGRCCSLCDGPSQLCTNHRWANSEVALCKDCILEARPCKVIEISGALETFTHRVVLSLLAKNPLNGITLLATKDSTLPYHDEIESSCHQWLVMLVNDIYEQDQAGEKRLSLQGNYSTREQYLAPGMCETASNAEWILEGKRTFSVSLVIPSFGSPKVFAEHQISLAAQSLTAYLAKSTLTSLVQPSTRLTNHDWRQTSD